MTSKVVTKDDFLRMWLFCGTVCRENGNESNETNLEEIGHIFGAW